VYGVAPGTAIKTEVVVRKGGGGGLFGKGGSAISLKFDDRSEGSVDRENRTLDLSRLKAGTYTIGVKVTRSDGATDSRIRQFTVIDP
jgi:hypothetical protein